MPELRQEVHAHQDKPILLLREVQLRDEGEANRRSESPSSSQVRSVRKGISAAQKASKVLFGRMLQEERMGDVAHVSRQARKEWICTDCVHSPCMRDMRKAVCAEEKASEVLFA